MLSGWLMSRDVFILIEPLNPLGALAEDWVIAPPSPWLPLSFTTLDLQSRLLTTVFIFSSPSHISDAYYDDSLFSLGYIILGMLTTQVGETSVIGTRGVIS